MDRTNPAMLGEDLQQDVKPITASPPDSSAMGHARKQSGGSGSTPRIRRRNRLITSCLECRRRKLKCDKLHPCTNCTKFVRDCVFLAPALDAASQLKLNEIKEKMGTLERTLEEDVARRNRASSTRSGASSTIPGALDSSEDEDQDGPEDEKDLEPTPLAVNDAAYYEDADDDFMDLGVLVGKMRLTERIGGFVRPKFSQEMSYVLQERTEKRDFPTEVDLHTPVIKSEYDLVKPALDFLAPSSSFFFAPEPQRSSFMIYLPSKNVADSLLNQYWHAVHPMCRVVHRPTFERQWVSFWQMVHTGSEPAASLQALVMGALLSALISMSDRAVSVQLGVPKVQLLQSFQQGAESALYRANFLRTTKLLTLQALVMYLIPLCRREVTRAHSALTGTAIRLAECMGLHRDGTNYGLSAVETHVRRIVWYQLCFLDIRTCEATGPRPQIHQDDFDTKYPLNVNDVDLESENPPTEDSDQWTDMTFSLMRFEVNEMHRFAWRERPRLEKKKTTLTALLRKVQDFITAMDKKYMPMLDRSQPIAKMSLLVYKVQTLRLHIMFLHRYASTRDKPMPERLRKILLTSSLQQVECAIMIDTDPALRPWAWYLGALHQYHTALVLLSETYATDVRYHEDRVWKCLDYVFECPPNLARKEKAKLILTEIVQKTEMYSSLRRVRAPQGLEEQAQLRHLKPDHRATQDHLAASFASSPSPPAPQFANPVDSHISMDAPNYSWPTNTLAPGQYNPARTPQISVPGAPISPNRSPSEGTAEIVRGRGGSFGSSNSPGDPMTDVDWNEWDKMFPPDVNLSDFGNLPDFQFSSYLPDGSM